MTRIVQLLALGVVASLLVGAGATYAGEGTKDGSRCEQALAKIAEKRGMTVEELQAKLKAGALARVKKAQEEGKITEEQAARLVERIEAGNGCKRLGKVVRKAKHSRGFVVRQSADYLGMTPQALVTQMREQGTSIAQIADATPGKSAAALKAELVADFKAKLDKAEKLSDEQKAKLLDAFGKRVDRVLNHVPKTTT